MSSVLKAQALYSRFITELSVIVLTNTANFHNIIHKNAGISDLIEFEP